MENVYRKLSFGNFPLSFSMEEENSPLDCFKSHVVQYFIGNSQHLEMSPESNRKALKSKYTLYAHGNPYEVINGPKLFFFY